MLSHTCICTVIVGSYILIILLIYSCQAPANSHPHHNHNFITIIARTELKHISLVHYGHSGPSYILKSISMITKTILDYILIPCMMMPCSIHSPKWLGHTEYYIYPISCISITDSMATMMILTRIKYYIVFNYIIKYSIGPNTNNYYHLIIIFDYILYIILYHFVFF